jgi:glyoxylase-like metal-dependent hydrolase (beta-lactamase superfamily II)
MPVRRVIPLTFGWEHLPKWISVHGAPPEPMREPAPGVLVEVDGGWVLLDTGFNTPLIRDPWLYARFFGGGPVEPELPTLAEGDGEPLEAAFALVGVDPADVVAVAVSHLHNDHAGGLRHFAGKVPVYCQKRELEWALANPVEAEKHAIFRIDFDDPRIDWRLPDGDDEIAPGLTALLTAGHTPGHQSFMVELDAGGGYVFAFDAADLQENIDEELPVGGAVLVSAEETLGPLLRIKALAAEKGYRLVPGHDPVVWPALAKELGVPMFT